MWVQEFKMTGERKKQKENCNKNKNNKCGVSVICTCEETLWRFGLLFRKYLPNEYSHEIILYYFKVQIVFQ